MQFYRNGIESEYYSSSDYFRLDSDFILYQEEQKDDYTVFNIGALKDTQQAREQLLEELTDDDIYLTSISVDKTMIGSDKYYRTYKGYLITYN